MTETVSVELEEQKKIFNELIKERSSEFMNLEKMINPDNLIYEYRTEEISPNIFRIYQDPIKLFKDLRDGNINLKEVLKDQINFKSDLDKNKKRKSKIKIKRSNKCNTRCWNSFDFRENIIDSFRDYSLLLSEAKYRVKHGISVKILTPKEMLQRLPIALAQLKAGNTSEKLSNEIRQIIYSQYWVK